MGWGGEDAGEQADSSKSKLRTHRALSEEEVVVGSLSGSLSVLKSQKQSWAIIILNFQVKWWRDWGGEGVSASPWQQKAFQKTVRQFSLRTKCTKCEVKTELVLNTICCEIKAISSFSLCFTLGIFVKKSCCLPVPKQWMFSNTPLFSE